MNNKVNKICKSGSNTGLDKLLISLVKSGLPRKSYQFFKEMLNEKRLWNRPKIAKKIHLRMITIQTAMVKTMKLKKWSARQMSMTYLIKQCELPVPSTMKMTMKIPRMNKITSKRFQEIWLGINKATIHQRPCLRESSE